MSKMKKAPMVTCSGRGHKWRPSKAGMRPRPDKVHHVQRTRKCPACGKTYYV